MPAAKKNAAAAPDGYTVVVSPTGDETTVPDEIKDRLIESGYTVK